MKEAIKNFTNRKSYQNGTNIVTVKEDGNATLYINGKLAGVTNGNKLYIKKEFYNFVEVACEYNSEWLEIDLEQELAAQDFDLYVETLSEEHGKIGNEDACPSGMEQEYNRGF